MKREKFMFFRNFFEAVPDEYRKDFCYALIRYAFLGELPEEGIIRSFVVLVTPSIDKNVGGAPKGNKNAQKKQSKTTVETTEKTTVVFNQKQPLKQQTEIETETEAETEAEEETMLPPSIPPVGEDLAKKRFKKPTVEEVRAYCLERGNGVDATAFVNFYEAKGWVVGRSPMKDWKAAVRTWEGKRGGQVVAAKPVQEPERDLIDEACGRGFPWDKAARIIEQQKADRERRNNADIANANRS